MPAISFLHVAVSVHDLDKAIEWYTTNFGFSEKKRGNKESLHIRSAILTLNGASLELIEPESPCVPQRVSGTLAQQLRNTGVNHFALQVENLQECFDTLQQQGTEMVTDIMGDRLFFCKDPDGTLIEIKRS